MRTRQDVNKLPPSDQTLHWYAIAIASMKARDDSDPLSWNFQGSIHGYDGTVPPSMRPFLDQCQHSTSFFLPWHRMYLLHFERIVASEVAVNGGPIDWALPYWDYTDRAHWILPDAFRDSTNSAGEPNALYVAERHPNANPGREILSSADVDLTSCMIAPGTTALGGFFGQDAAAHFGQHAGSLELTPHNAIHRAVGGNWGLMADPYTAALDPIFWLHHANIDRLWEVWILRDHSHYNLASPYWLSGVTFDFHDEHGSPVSMKTEDILDLTHPDIAYQYEDTSDPLSVSPAAIASADTPENVTEKKDVELVGATLKPLKLGATASRVTVPTPVTEESVMIANAAADGTTAEKATQILLVLDNVTSAAICPTYDVYLDVNGDGQPDEDWFVGRAALFGIAQASDPGGHHGGSGQRLVFDITNIYRKLQEAGKLDPQALHISFMPVETEDETEVSVGRVSLYFS